MAVNILNLTNTKWVINDEPEISGSLITFNITFLSMGNTYSSLTKGISNGDALIKYNSETWYDYYDVGWDSDLARIIEITGGTDVTNTTLIAWLEANATQVEITYKTFDLSTLQLSAGTHTIQVKARATGYLDSEFSNSINYVVASGFNLIAGQYGFNTGYNSFLGSGNVLEYSLDDGSTWQTFNKNFAANETILTGITQIKFKISKAPMTHGADRYDISSTKLNLDMYIEGNSAEDTKTSSNFVLTQDIDDLYGNSFVD